MRDPSTFGHKVTLKFGKGCNRKLLNPKCLPITLILDANILSVPCDPDYTMIGFITEGSVISGLTC